MSSKDEVYDQGRRQCPLADGKLRLMATLSDFAAYAFVPAFGSSATPIWQAVLWCASARLLAGVCPRGGRSAVAYGRYHDYRTIAPRGRPAHPDDRHLAAGARRPGERPGPAEGRRDARQRPDLRHGLQGPALQLARQDQQGHGEVPGPRLRLLLWWREATRAGEPAAPRRRHHLRHRLLLAPVRRRQPDRHEEVAVRRPPAGGYPALLRRRQPGRRALQGQGLLHDAG